MAALLAGLFVVTHSLPSAGQERKLPVVGQLYHTTPTLSKPFDDAFREGLRELGYVDGRNVTLVPFYAEGKQEQIRVLVNKLISAKVDVMVVPAIAVDVATEATKTIPIVCPGLVDPVRTGLVKSLAHPGGNLTGMSFQSWEIGFKSFQILTEMLPGLNRAVLLYDANFRDDAVAAREQQSFARRKGIALRLAGVRTPDEIRSAISGVEKLGEKALIVYDNPFTWLHRQTIIDLAAHRVPIVSERRAWAQAGALFTYAADGLDLSRRSAKQVAKILGGAKPGDLPIEQADKFDFIVNLKTAREFQITIPDSVLARADEVIR